MKAHGETDPPTRSWRRTAVRVALFVVVAGLAVFVPAAIADTAPSWTQLPTITGVAQQGQTLTAQSGSWGGTTPITFTYQWRVCDSGGGSCSDISGATSQTYTISASTVSVGSTIRVAVKATNTAGNSTALSTWTQAVTAAGAPLNTAAPQITGTAQQGATLNATNGSWSGTGTITYTYQWEHCDSGGSSCSSIGGATNSSYVPTGSDVHNTVRVKVTATNSSGDSSAVSGSSAVIASSGGAPVNTGVPTISGALTEGSTLTVSQGGWQGSSPISYAYGWQRCDASGDKCSNISGATGSKYKLQHADVGLRIRGTVTASNSIGATTAYSPLSAIVASLLEPVNTALPTISGVVAVGQTLRASVGSWSGKTPMQYYFQWARSNGKGGFDPVPGATQQSYKLTSADLNHKLFVQVKAQNSYGPAWANSAPTATVGSSAPARAAVAVSSVSLPDQLVIGNVKFTPKVLRTRKSFQARFVVTNSEGAPVQGALVYIVGLPYHWVAAVKEGRTGADGSVTFTVVPTVRLPVGRPGALVMFVRARKPGDSVLAGVSTRRLVQVRLR